jgi:hypothetical protein
MNRSIKSLILLSLVVAFGPPPATTQPAGDSRPASRPTLVDGKPSSGDAIVDDVLDRLEARGKAAHAIECNIVYTYITAGPIEGMDEREEKIGVLSYAQSGASRFLVRFDKKVAAGVVNKEKEYYAFDGEWLTERNDRAKTIVRREIVRKGETVDLFDLDRGPFPVPFGRSREEMLRHFEIRRQSFHVGDDNKPIVLRCLPRPGTDLASRYRFVDLEIDPKLDMPTSVVCQRAADDNRIEVRFSTIKEKDTIEPNQFEVSIPKEFQLTVEPLDEKSPPTGTSPKP